MKEKNDRNDRLEVLRQIISKRQMGSQEEILRALQRKGFIVTQATLSRDLKQLKVAKTSTKTGAYAYVLPNETQYHRVGTTSSEREMMQGSGILDVRFSGNLCVVKTRPGHAGAVAYNIDQAAIPEVLGTVAGYDCILMVIAEGVEREEVIEALTEALHSD